MHAGPVVATSLDPRERLPHQLACFARWRELGLACVSFNDAQERAQLLRAGLSEAEAVSVPAGATVATPAGRSSPRLLAMLQRLREASAAPLLVVQPDVYPTVPHDPLPLLAAQGSAVGLVAFDCLALDQPNEAPRTPRHEALDGFAFDATGLELVLGRIGRHAAGEGLALDVPGSDLLLGHALLAEGGDLLEVPFLLHPRHPLPPPGDGPFTPMAQVMFASGRYGSRTPADLAAEFARVIASRCAANAARSRVLARAGGDGSEAAPRLPSATTEAPPVVQRLAAGLAGADVPDLLMRQLARPDWVALQLLYSRLEPAATPLEASLRALHAGLQLHRAAGRPPLALLGRSPGHAERLRLQMALTDAAARRRGIVALFARMLLEDGVLDTNLFKYVLTQCAHEAEQRLAVALLRELRAETRDHAQPAAAA